MLTKKSDEIKAREITPKETYLNRRTFLQGAGLLATTAATGALYRTLNAPSLPPRETQKIELADAAANPNNAAPTSSSGDSGFKTNETLTSKRDITNYNNFYEFSTSKGEVADAARDFVTRPWTVSVEGRVNKPRTFDIDEIFKFAPAEERIYRHRCVEGWSMVIPWVGFSLAKLLAAVEPLSTAKYVAFETLYDPNRFPNQGTLRRALTGLDWPYVEGLRIDEAMHPLTLLTTGLYGETLPPQDGAPLRLIVPWKYGFKGIKSIVKIKLVAIEPPTTWNLAAPDEYGFYSNVNPNVPHPRWSQATETRIGEFSRRATLMFNGYAEQVGQMYAGMDLRRYF